MGWLGTDTRPAVQVEALWALTNIAHGATDHAQVQEGGGGDEGFRIIYRDALSYCTLHLGGVCWCVGGGGGKKKLEITFKRLIRLAMGNVSGLLVRQPIKSVEGFEFSRQRQGNVFCFVFSLYHLMRESWMN